MSKTKTTKNADLLEAGKRYAIVAEKSGRVIGLINTPRNGRDKDVPIELEEGTKAYAYSGPSTIAGRLATEISGFSPDDSKAIAEAYEKANPKAESPMPTTAKPATGVTVTSEESKD